MLYCEILTESCAGNISSVVDYMLCNKCKHTARGAVHSYLIVSHGCIALRVRSICIFCAHNGAGTDALFAFYAFSVIYYRSNKTLLIPTERNCVYRTGIVTSRATYAVAVLKIIYCDGFIGEYYRVRNNRCQSRIGRFRCRCLFRRSILLLGSGWHSVGEKCSFGCDKCADYPVVSVHIPRYSFQNFSVVI